MKESIKHMKNLIPGLQPCETLALSSAGRLFLLQGSRTEERPASSATASSTSKKNTKANDTNTKTRARKNCHHRRPRQRDAPTVLVRGQSSAGMPLRALPPRHRRRGNGTIHPPLGPLPAPTRTHASTVQAAVLLPRMLLRWLVPKATG